MRARWHLALALAIASCAPPAPSRGDASAPATDASRAHDAGDAATRTADARDAGTSDDATMPAAASEELSTRMRHLVEAIAQDNPELAADVLLPRDAYLAAYDAQDPGKVWDRKVSGLFRKQVHAAHKRIKGSDKSRFVSFEIGRAITQASPKRHGLKRPFWRVKRSRLLLSVDGKEHKLEIAEMIAWRGAWYVAKLR